VRENFLKLYINIQIKKRLWRGAESRIQKQIEKIKIKTKAERTTFNIQLNV